MFLFVAPESRECKDEYLSLPGGGSHCSYDHSSVPDDQWRHHGEAKRGQRHVASNTTRTNSGSRVSFCPLSISLATAENQGPLHLFPSPQAVKLEYHVL